MTTRRLSFVLLLSALVVLALVKSAATAPPPQPTGGCSPGPADCFAWHTSNVTVSWSSPPAGVTVASGCGSVTISNDTGGTPVGCTWKSGSGETSAVTLIVRRDATPPSVRGSADRGPDANGWYTRGVTIEFSGSDALSGISGCSSAASYGGPDSGAARVSGTCTDGAGNTGSTTYELKYDATPPSVEAKPDRQPNAKGWYNRSVTVAFVGSDAVAGVDSCDPPVLYKGPDSPKATLSGACRDKAANASPPVSFELKYDTRPPKLGKVRAEIGSRGVVLRWAASKDTFSVAVVRRPGLRGRKPSTLYSGPARTFTDRRLRKDVKYRYTVTAYDEAGNGAVKALVAQLDSPLEQPAAKNPAAKRPALTTPAPGARLATPPLLAWAAVPQATYYNVQLYRDGRKILSVWPDRPLFRLQGSWQFDGRTYRLSPGRYRWYVWPGFGPRSANRYGKQLGTRTFVVVG